ncbi:MAG: hypothetical protein ACLSEU_08005 [Streptococcus salivarius]
MLGLKIELALLLDFFQHRKILEASQKSAAQKLSIDELIKAGYRYDNNDTLLVSFLAFSIFVQFMQIALIS